MTDLDDGRSPDGGVRRRTTPPTVRLAAAGLWLRAALRLPVLVFVGFYVFHGIVIGHRSGDFPDGAFFAWLYYTVSETDNYLTVPAGWLADAVIGWPSMASWMVAYSAVTAGYLAVGLLLWRGTRLRPGGYRATLRYLVLSAVVHLLTLIIVAPGAVDAVRTGENAPVNPYPGMTMIHAYEWLLLPWSLSLPAITVAVIALLRTSSARSHLGWTAS